MRVLIITSMLCAVLALKVSAATLDHYHFHEISDQDLEARVANPYGMLEVVIPGSVVDGAVVTEISKNKVVLEKQVEGGVEVTTVVKKGKNQTVSHEIVPQ